MQGLSAQFLGLGGQAAPFIICESQPLALHCLPIHPQLLLLKLNDVQLLPLELKDKELERQLEEFVLAMEKYLLELPTKPRLKRLEFGPILGIMTEHLWHQLRDTKRNMAQALLLEHLHEIRPLCQS